MNDSTVQTISGKLDQLAAKLGVAVAHLWTALIRQQYLDGWMNVLYAVLGLAMLYGLGRLFRHARKAEKEAKGYDDGGYYIAYAVMGFAAAVVLVFTLCSVHDALTCFANPEYAAFKEIAGLLK